MPGNQLTVSVSTSMVVQELFAQIIVRNFTVWAPVYFLLLGMDRMDFSWAWSINLKLKYQLTFLAPLSSKLNSMELFQADVWRCWNLLLWNTGLWSCFFCLIYFLQHSQSHDHHSWGCLQLSCSQPILETE